MTGQTDWRAVAAATGGADREVAEAGVRLAYRSAGARGAAADRVGGIAAGGVAVAGPRRAGVGAGGARAQRARRGAQRAVGGPAGPAARSGSGRAAGASTGTRRGRGSESPVQALVDRVRAGLVERSPRSPARRRRYGCCCSTRCWGSTTRRGCAPSIRSGARPWRGWPRWQGAAGWWWPYTSGWPWSASGRWSCTGTKAGRLDRGRRSGAGLSGRLPPPRVAGDAGARRVPRGARVAHTGADQGRGRTPSCAG